MWECIVIRTSWVSAVISLVPRACRSLNFPTTCDQTCNALKINSKHQNIWLQGQTFSSVFRLYRLRSLNRSANIGWLLNMVSLYLFTAVGSTIEWYTISPFSGSYNKTLKIYFGWILSLVTIDTLGHSQSFSEKLQQEIQFTSHFEWIDLWTLLVLQGFWARYHTG